MQKWHYYVIAVIAFLFFNSVLMLLGLPRVGWLWIILFLLVAREVHQWRSRGPTGQDLVKEAREHDQSWTDADDQTFKELLRKQRQ
jgi:hypothetical protein